MINLLPLFSPALTLNHQKLADTESNMDISSVLKANDYSDPRKADLLVSISTVDAAAPIIHLIFHCKIVMFRLSSPGGHDYCSVHHINYFLFQISHLKITDTTRQGHGKQTCSLMLQKETTGKNKQPAVNILILKA